MPRSSPVISLDEQLRLRQTVYRFVFLRGYTQTKAAELIGISTGRVSQLLSESIADFKERVRNRTRESTEDRLTRRLEQYQELREEAFLAWERSKSNQEVSTEEQNLKTIYRDVMGADGKAERVPSGEQLKVVKAIRRIEGRNPANEYLRTVLTALAEESKLEGLIEEKVISVMNNNVAGDQNNTINWNTLLTRPKTPDMIEAQIASASAPPVAIAPMPPTSFNEFDLNKVHEVTEQPVGEWTPAEAADLDDDPHLNGDGA